MVRMSFPPRPPGVLGMIPIAPRPPIPGVRAPIIPPIIRPATIPNVTQTGKPQTTVYVGKIASTVENDFMLSILQLCGPVTSWKRPQDTTSGTLKGFGFCEFESAEGVLRALRLLSKVNVDCQELMLNVDEATKKYLRCYVENKGKNSENLKASENEGGEKEDGGSLDAKKSDTQKPSVESPKSDTGDSKKEDNDPSKKDAIVNFGVVNDQDREADREALEKLTGMIEERVKTRPPPPPPSQATADGSGNSNSDLAATSDVDMVKIDATTGKNDEEMNSESKPRGELDRPETSSPDRRHDRWSRDRERDLKWEKERELERYEREREQERLRREREMEYKIREGERRFKVRVKDWESRERKKKRLREEEEITKERKHDRQWLIQEQGHENDDSYGKRRKYKSSGEERTRRLREKEEDLADRLKEEEEIAEATRRAQEEKCQRKEREKMELLAGQMPNGNDSILPNIPDVECKNGVLQIFDHDFGHDNHIVAGGKTVQNGSGDESIGGSFSTPDMLQDGNAPARKLGFGLVGSGKRTTVPSVFNQEEDEDAQKEKKMRPLVPIDYSTEELQAVQPSFSGALSPNLAAAAEFAKRISNVNPKEERLDADKEKVRRSVERSSQRDRARHHEESNHRRDESRETRDRDRDREHKPEKLRTPDNQKLLDAKQLIDMIPKTKDELFSYDINWAIYDKNKLHERMRPWISKKITEFLGEEEETLVSYIVSSTQEHVKASEMLERLQAILDDEAEMFVLKMWRMLIFEIKRVETGLALRSKR